MARLFVVGNPNNLTPTLRKALEREAQRPKPIIKITEFVYLLGPDEENNPQIGLDNAKALIAETLLLLDIKPNDQDAVLAKGSSVLYLAACRAIEEAAQGQTPKRIIPWGRSFRVRHGPLGRGQAVKPS